MPKKKKVAGRAEKQAASAAKRPTPRKSSPTVTKAIDRQASEPAPIKGCYMIRDVEQLRAIANPTRMKILTEFVSEARTTKQVAQRLNLPPTRLYHHVDALVEQGLLQLERETPKRGTTEKYYQAVAQRFRVDDQCIEDAGFEDERSRYVVDLLNRTREGVIDGLSSGTSSQVIAAACEIDMSINEAEQFTDQLMDLITAFEKSKAKSKPSEPRTSYSVSVLIYPSTANDS